MTWWKPTTFSAIGVDFGRHSVKAVQLAHGHAGWRIAAAATFALPTPDAAPDATQVQRLRGVLERQGFLGNRIVLAAPGHQLKIHTLELPPRSSGAPLDQIARMEMARTCQLEPQSIELAAWDIPAPPRSADATHMMALAIKQSDADALLDLFDDSGLHVAALDSPAWALARSCGQLTQNGGPAANSSTAILDIGWNSAMLVLVHAGQVIFQRVLQAGSLAGLHHEAARQLNAPLDVAEAALAQMTLGETAGGATSLAGIGPQSGSGVPPLMGAEQRRDAAATLQATGMAPPTACDGFVATQTSAALRNLVARHTDALAAEVRSSLSYATHRYPDLPVGRLYMVGGGAGLAGLEQLMSTELGIEAKAARPAGAATCNQNLLERGGSPAAMMALGLALHEEA